MAGQKIKIYDLAKELKVDNKRVIDDARREGIDVSVPSNTVPMEVAERIRTKYYPKKMIPTKVIPATAGHLKSATAGHLKMVKLDNLLSFGPGTPALELQRLNVLIGPNGSGKSNLIEAFALLRSTPVPPQATSNSDVRGVVRRGGGVREWVWKGEQDEPASVEVIVSNPKGKQPLRHLLALRSHEQGFRLHDELVENDRPYGNQPEPFFYYRFQDGHPVINTGRTERKLARESVNLELSILSQRRDPEQYPEITYLAETYERWRIYREWAFGRNTVFREPQKADMRNDRLEEDFSNLGLFLSRLRRTPKAKRAILEGLTDLYEGLTDFEPIVEGGSVQVFFTEGDFAIPATRLSDGTLRYLCLLAILCDPEPPPLICIEEPELGLHPDILPKLADLLLAASQRTQIIVTTHSDILVDAMTEHPEAIVVCEKHEGRTQMRRLKPAELSIWLEKYRLGQLWTKGQIGGTRW
jgi:predicted ATPase